MYKVYLVEDESAVRNAIRDRIEWEEAGFIFTGEAPDGEIALREICELQPDLVITDIRMPFMDGLSLSVRLRERFPRMRIVILTGHDDFEYAQRAISCGVSDYLLKPLSADKLIKTLKRMHDHMDEERSLVMKAEKFATYREQEFLRSLCEEAPDTSEFMREAELFGLTPSECWFLVLLIKPAYPEAEPDPERKALKDKVRNYLSWLAGDAPDYRYFDYAPGCSAILLRNEEREALEEKAFLFASTIQDQLKTMFSLPAAIAIGKSINSLEKLCDSCRDALSLMRDDLYFNRVLFREKEDSRSAMVADRCRNLVVQHYDNPDLSLSMAAAEVSVSPGRLSTLFHQETGERFISFLNRYRLEKSRELLETTDLSVAAVAEACGYNQAHYFSSLFKRTYGSSPLGFKQQKQLA